MDITEWLRKGEGRKTGGSLLGRSGAGVGRKYKRVKEEQ